MQQTHDADARRHCLMLVNNPCVNDSRVIKSAEALIAGGWRVTVIARRAENVAQRTTRNGVDYVRVGGLKSAAQELGRKRLRRNTSIDARNQVNTTPTGNGPGLLDRLKSLMRQAFWYFETEEYALASETAWRRLRFDAVHAHDLSTLPAGSRAARSRGVPLIYDSHELETHRNANYSRAVMRKREAIERREIARTRAVITVSESIADHLASHYEIARPLVVLNAPSFSQAVSADGEDVRQRLRLPADTPLLIYVGSVTFNRGVEQGIAALHHVPSAHLVLLGPRQPQMESRLRSLLRDPALAARVHMVDPVAPEKVVSFISGADASLLAIQDACLSYRYCMPNKLLESVFAGVPVIVSNFPDMRRFVLEHGCGEVVDGAAPQSIAESFLRIVAQRAKYALDADARDRLAGSFGWPAQANRLQRLYDSLVH